MNKLDKIIIILAFAIATIGGWCIISAALHSPIVVLDVLLGVAVGLFVTSAIISFTNDDRRARKKQRKIINRVRDMLMEDEE